MSLSIAYSSINLHIIFLPWLIHGFYDYFLMAPPLLTPPNMDTSGAGAGEDFKPLIVGGFVLAALTNATGVVYAVRSIYDLEQDTQDELPRVPAATWHSRQGIEQACI